MSSFDSLALVRLSSSPSKGMVMLTMVAVWLSGEIMTRSGLFLSGSPGISCSTNLLPSDQALQDVVMPLADEAHADRLRPGRRSSFLRAEQMEQSTSFAHDLLGRRVCSL